MGNEKTMHAVTFSRPGPPEVLEWTQVPSPAPGPNEVLIDVQAAGLNHADLLQRRGLYPPPPGASEILGLECAGRIAQLGNNVKGWQVGDSVCALLSGGAYAEKAVAFADQLLPLPGKYDAIHAASLVEVACTVFSNLSMKAGLQSGMSLLIHGGASGIGTFAIQWAKSLGAKVLVTAGSAAKLQRCTQLGADVGINYRTQDFVAETLVATAKRGADVILDIVGAEYLDRNLRCLAPDGQLVVIGSTDYVEDRPLNLKLMMAKRLSIVSTGLRMRPPEQKAHIIREVQRHVWPLVATGAIAPVIHSVVPMPRAAEAHRLLEEGTAMGKVVLSTPSA
jgi:putative PIG3 family NAD(P)H quinone oxidoreductase